MDSNNKAKRTKEKIPAVATSDKWREYHEQKIKLKKKKEEKKEKKKIKVKIKKEKAIL